MVLPLIPIALIAGGTALGGTAIASFFGSQSTKETELQKQKDVFLSGLANSQKVDALAYQNQMNPNSQFQRPGEGWFSNYSQNDLRQFQETVTTNNYTITESPNAQISAKQDIVPTQTRTDPGSPKNPFEGMLTSLGGSVGTMLLVILVVGVGYLFLRNSGKKN